MDMELHGWHTAQVGMSFKLISAAAAVAARKRET